MTDRIVLADPAGTRGTVYPEGGQAFFGPLPPPAGTDERATYDRLIAAGVVPTYTPPPPPIRHALGSTLRDALKAAETAGKGWQTAWTTALRAQSQDTQDSWVSAYRDDILINAVKLVRIAAAANVPLPDLYTLAGA